MGFISLATDDVSIPMQCALRSSDAGNVPKVTSQSNRCYVADGIIMFSLTAKTTLFVITLLLPPKTVLSNITFLQPLNTVLFVIRLLLPPKTVLFVIKFLLPSNTKRQRNISGQKTKDHIRAKDKKITSGPKTKDHIWAKDKG